MLCGVILLCKCNYSDSSLWKLMDQIRIPDFYMTSLSFHTHIATLVCSFTPIEVQIGLISNCCLISVHLLEHDIEWRLLPVGILCSRRACPGWGQQAGGCRKGAVLPLICNSVTTWGWNPCNQYMLYDLLPSIPEYEHTRNSILACV